MKIILAAGIYPPDIGGPATYAKMLEEGLCGAGIEVKVVPYGLVRSLPKWRRHLAYMRLLWRETGTSDIIYALDPISVGLPARVVSILRHKHLVVRLGGDYAWEQGVQRFGVTNTLDEYSVGKTKQSWPVWLLAHLQSFVVKGAVAVIVPSHYLESIVMSWGVKKERIKVIYSALHPLQPLDDRQILREDFLFSGLVISSVGRLAPWKGFKTMIDVIARKKDGGDLATLVIVGDGPEKSNLENYIKEKNVEENVRMVGALTRDAMAAVVFASDIFVLNTAYEGLSHQLLEVMDIGTPIITTDIGGNRELITNGAQGVLVPVNDTEAILKSINKIALDHEFKEHLVAGAKDRVTYFKSDKVIESMSNLFKSLK